MERKPDQIDPYDELGVDMGASRRDIVRAYRRLAHEWHPDVHQEDPSAVARFRAITAAYDLLTDANRRTEYDHKRDTRTTAATARAPQPRATQRGVVRFTSPGRRDLLRVGPVHIAPVVGARSVDEEQE